MRGHNQIRMNQATMLEAIQLWLDSEFKDPPKVTSVETDKNPPICNSSSEAFVVKLQKDEPKK